MHKIPRPDPLDKFLRTIWRRKRSGEEMDGQCTSQTHAAHPTRARSLAPPEPSSARMTHSREGRPRCRYRRSDPRCVIPKSPAFTKSLRHSEAPRFYQRGEESRVERHRWSGGPGIESATPNLKRLLRPCGFCKGGHDAACTRRLRRALKTGGGSRSAPAFAKHAKNATPVSILWFGNSKG